MCMCVHIERAGCVCAGGKGAGCSVRGAASAGVRRGHMTTVHTVSCPFGGWVGDPARPWAPAINFIYSYAASERAPRRLVMSSTVTFLAFRSRSVFNSCFKTGRAGSRRRRR